MLKFECKNGSIDILNVRESRSFNDIGKVKMLEITIDGQNISLDSVEETLTVPETITDFEIRNEKTGVVIGQFEGYKMNNMCRNTQGNNIINIISFMKESSQNG